MCLKTKEERLRALVEEKQVIILTLPLLNAIDSVEQAKEYIFHRHLSTLAEELPNLKVWQNPLVRYEEDGGRHPSPQQTGELLKHIDLKAKEDFKESIFLESGPNELITTKNKYRGVRSLYKYGCAACSDKSRNYWWCLCSTCTARAKDPDECKIRSALTALHSIANEIREKETPILPSKTTYREHSPLRNERSNRESDGKDDKCGCKRFKFCYDGNE